MLLGDDGSGPGGDAGGSEGGEVGGVVVATMDRENFLRWRLRTQKQRGQKKCRNSESDRTPPRRQLVSLLPLSLLTEDFRFE